MLDRFGEPEQQKNDDIEKTKQADQNDILDKASNYIEYKVQLDKVLEYVNEELSKKNEKPLVYSVFVEITNNILIDLKKDGYL